MARRLRYKPHHGAAPTRDNPFPGMKAFLVSDQVRDPAVKAARDIAAEAARLTPRSNRTGPHMADSWQVNEDTAPVKVGKQQNARVGAEVFNDVKRSGSDESHAAAAEFGKGRARGHRALGRAAATMGSASDG